MTAERAGEAPHPAYLPDEVIRYLKARDKATLVDIIAQLTAGRFLGHRDLEEAVWRANVNRAQRAVDAADAAYEAAKHAKDQKVVGSWAWVQCWEDAERAFDRLEAAWDARSAAWVPGPPWAATGPSDNPRKTGRKR